MRNNLVAQDLQIRYTMANKSPIPPMPNDIKQRARELKGLDPKNPNDVAFEMVTMFVFFCVTKLTPPFFFFENSTTTRLSLPPMLFINRFPPPVPPHLGGSV